MVHPFAEQMTTIATTIEAAITTATQCIVQAEMAQRTAEAEIEIVRSESELALTKQWYAIALKILEHRFTSAPIALVLLLQTVTPTQRNPVTDLLLDAPTAEACLQTVRELLNTQAGGPTK